MKARLDPAFGKIIKTIRGTIDLVRDKPCYKDLREKLEDAARRYEDPYLKLAVIGDFSCGKSTLLNALFQRDLLGMAMLPATAVATYIRWDRTKAGDDVSVRVVDADGGCYDATGDGLLRLEAYLGRDLPEDLGQLVDALTTNNALAGRLSRVELSFPARPDRGGICLIDTPGINAGMEGTQAHAGITTQLLAREADAAMVLFPSNLVLTGSLLTFLQENAAHLLGDSYFLITKIDLIVKEKERELMHRMVESQMEGLTGRRPRVYAVSAGMALDHALHPDRAAKDADRWAEDFEKVFREIFADLARCRERLIRERLRDLLRQLTGELSAEIGAQTDLLEERRRALEENDPASMRDEIEKICKKSWNNFSAKKTSYLSSVESSVFSVFNQKKQTIFGEIRACTSRGAVNRYVRQDLQGKVGGIRGELNKTMKKTINGFNTSIRDTVARCENKVQECYAQYRVNIGAKSHKAKRLDTAGLNAGHDITAHGYTNATIPSTLLDFLGSAGDVVEDLFDLDFSSLFSDLGFLFWELLDNLIELFKPLSTQKEELIESIDSSLNKSMKEIIAQYKDALGAVFDKNAALLESLPDIYEESYRQEYLAACENYNAEKIEVGRALDIRRSAWKKLENAARVLEKV